MTILLEYPESLFHLPVYSGQINFHFSDNTVKSMGLPVVAINSTKHNNFSTIEEDIFDNASRVEINYTDSTGVHCVQYTTSDKSILKYAPKTPSTTVATKSITSHFRKNKNTLFSDTDMDKQHILNMASSKTTNINNTKDVRIKGKNLIYYVLGHDKKYLDILELSIMSIKKYNDLTAFDIILLTDKEMHIAVRNRPELFDCIKDFHILDKVADGISASMLKTQIFDYKKINKYGKVLFLDCDILCAGDISQIFDLATDTNTLYVACNANADYTWHQTLFHGLQFNELNAADMSNHKQLPFNAGQFMFINSSRMAQHFKNINWLMNTWPGKYFFEQSFLNYYMCKNHMSNHAIFDSVVQLITSKITDNIQKEHTTATLLHFIAPALNAEVKYNFMSNYKKFT